MDYILLEKYLRQLFNGYLNKYNLSVDDKNDVIQDSLLQLWRKEQDGTLVGDIEHNKNYIFITVRNFVYMKSGRKKKFLNHIQINEELDIPTKEMDLIELADIQSKKDLIVSIMKEDSFSDFERTIIDHIFIGNQIRDIVRIEKQPLHIVRNGYANLKYKLKIRLEFIDNPLYKFKVTLQNGMEYKFKNQKSVANFVGIPQTTFSYWKNKGRTIFKNFTLEYLS